VLLSWALPEGPSCHAGVIRRAIEMKDHRRANLLFEGVHETGPIMLWDRGTWTPDPDCEDIQRGLREGVLRFILRGEKLQGSWILTRVNKPNVPRPVWKLCKENDLFAERDMNLCILKERPNSVATGRTMEEIVRDWTRPDDKFLLQAKLFVEGGI